VQKGGLDVQFSNWGTRTPGGMRELEGSNAMLMLGLGVLEYQRIENLITD